MHLVLGLLLLEAPLLLGPGKGRRVDSVYIVRVAAGPKNQAQVHPNSELSQLTRGPNLIHMFNNYTDSRSSRRDPMPQACYTITLIEDLQ